MKLFGNALILVFGLCVSGTTFAHATIGIFDVNPALFQTDAWQAQLEELEEQFSEEQRTVAQLQSELEEIFSNIEINGPTMVEIEIRRLTEEGQVKQLRMQQIGERIRTSLQETQNNFLERYRNLLGNALNEVYEQGNFDFILKADSVVISGFSLDVTPNVTAKLNEMIASTGQ